MTSFVNAQVFLGALLLVSLIGVQGHSYVTSPQSRSNQKQTQTGCRGPNCLGPCEVPLSRRSANAAVHSASRGDKITVQWPRNNHAGGFIRFAWAPTTQSDNATYFDERVQQISCHETGGCFPDDPKNPNGGDSGPGDGSSRACSQSLTIPADLTDGKWTLQWAWFGGAFSLGDYYSCIDYNIAGGASGSTPVPTFVGGDYTYPNQQKCKFFNTDKLHVCINEPCSNPIYTAAAAQSGVPAYVQKDFPVAPVSPPATPEPKPLTTMPMTTSPLTTAATVVALPSTTAAVEVSKPATTGADVKIPPISTPTGQSISCVSGNMKCLSESSSIFSTCAHGAWGVAQSCPVGTACSPSGDFIYCLKPSTPTSESKPSTSTPSTAPTPTTPTDTSTTPTDTSTSSTGPISSSCTLGYQQCVGTNTYQACGNGVNGPTWAGVQSCQPGLSCHPSATANNIYCY